MELFRVTVKSEIIYFTTTKDIRVTVLSTYVSLKFIFRRLQKDEDQRKEKCHTKSMMCNEVNERLKRDTHHVSLRHMLKDSFVSKKVYYGSRKRKIKARLICEYRCDERLKN